jgi:hypothetical protein
MNMKIRLSTLKKIIKEVIENPVSDWKQNKFGDWEKQFVDKKVIIKQIDTKKTKKAFSPFDEESGSTPQLSSPVFQGRDQEKYNRRTTRAGENRYDTVFEYDVRVITSDDSYSLGRYKSADEAKDFVDKRYNK